MQTPMATKAEIQREMDSIRSMKRISSQSGPGSLTLDPDLPPSGSPGTTSNLSPTLGISGLNLPGPGGSGPVPTQQEAEDEAIAGDGFFWVPASLHPELAPSEFKAFLRNHRRDVEDGEDEGSGSAAGLGRMGSTSLQRTASGLSRRSSGLSRQRSLLSRQYHPGEDDGDDGNGDEVRPMKRNRSVYANAAPQLTIKDLQKLDDLADAAAAGKGGEASRIRSQLRRSMSLGLAGNIIDQIDAIQDDEENAPVIVPAKALQRTARTRIRKPGLEGDGNGHRFPSSRRGKRGKTMDPSMTHGDLQGYDDSSRPMSDLTTSDRTSLSDQEGEPYHRPQAPSPEAFDGEVDMANRPRFAGSTQADERPVSIGESIYDAYGGSDGGDIYYDARESGQYDKEYSRVTSGGSFSTPKGEEEDDEPFFTGSNAVPVEYSAPKKTAPTVILRPHSPEEAPEQLPLTSKSPPRDKKPTPAGPGPAPVPYHGAAASTPSFVKEYGYQQHYGQTSQQHQAQPAGMHHPAPQRHLDVPPAPHSSISPPSSPELVRSPSLSPSAEGPYVRPFSAPPTTSDRPSSAEKKEKAEKDKKSRGLFGWGGSKDKEKEKEKEKEREKEKEKEKEKKERDLLKKQKKEKSESKSSGKEEKESGGGLFGIFGSKKKHDSDSSSSHGSTNPSSQTNRYPGAKGQLMPFATVSPALAGQYARYPLHVERAVYRLSHIKLANPRRPLYEQVLISNLMFWYLGIINKPATPPTEAKPAVQAGDGPTTNQSPSVSSSLPAQSAADSNGQPVMSTAMSPAQQAAAAQAAAAAAAAEKTKLEREKKEQQEREEREREMQEMQERERRERDQRERMEREKAEKEREKSAKKTGLTKADRDGRSRRAEMPVKTPNYDAQSRIMEQQYWEQDRERSGSGRPNTAPGSSSPPTPAQSHTAYHLPVRVQQRGAPGPQQPYFYQQDLSQVVYQPINPYALPPGAKPPAPVENTWAVTSSAAAHANEIKRGQSPPSQYYSSGAAPAAGANDRPRPSRSPPPQEYSVQPSGMPNGARPARSLSATAVNKPSGPTASGSFPPTNPPSSSADYGRERPVAHQYSQSASPVINGGSSNPQPAVGSSSSGRLQKKKSTNNTNNTNNGPNDGTKPPARRRKSLEVGAGDRRGIVEPDISFESMWQQVQGQIHYGQSVGYDQPQQPQGQQGYTSYR